MRSHKTNMESLTLVRTAVTMSTTQLDRGTTSRDLIDKPAMLCLMKMTKNFMEESGASLQCQPNRTLAQAPQTVRHPGAARKPMPKISAAAPAHDSEWEDMCLFEETPSTEPWTFRDLIPLGRSGGGVLVWFVDVVIDVLVVQVQQIPRVQAVRRQSRSAATAVDVPVLMQLEFQQSMPYMILQYLRFSSSADPANIPVVPQRRVHTVQAVQKNRESTGTVLGTVVGKTVVCYDRCRWAVQTVEVLQLQFIDGGRRCDHAATSSNSFQLVGGASDQFIDKVVDFQSRGVAGVALPERRRVLETEEDSMDFQFLAPGYRESVCCSWLLTVQGCEHESDVACQRMCDRALASCARKNTPASREVIAQ